VFKKIIAPVIIGGVLLGGVASSGVASAATPTPAAKTSTASASQIKTWVRHHRRELRRAGLYLSAKTIGITPQTLKSDLKAGNSVAGVATQHGVSTQTVVNALVSAADGKVSKAVTAGKLTSTQASTIEAKIPGAVTKLVNHTF
jgi:hypothetical protein